MASGSRVNIVKATLTGVNNAYTVGAKNTDNAVATTKIGANYPIFSGQYTLNVKNNVIYDKTTLASLFAK